MKDKYLSKDAIAEKYDFRCDVIKFAEKLGLIGGGLYSISGVAFEDIRMIGIGAGIGVVSVLSGNYLNNMNEKKKEKALRNLEMAFEGERK